MKIIAKFLQKCPKDISCHQFCIGASKAIAKNYGRKQIERLVEHPEERLCASAIIYSRLRREIWMIGDCQCLVNEEYYDNPKPYEAELAQQRADIINTSDNKEHFLVNDTARQAIIPHMLETMKNQNITYAVIDGFRIPEQYVRVLTLSFQPWQIVLASDGYPFLERTLDESEARLMHQLKTDPLNIGEFKATKAFMDGNNSFDDRAYIRFNV